MTRPIFAAGELRPGIEICIDSPDLLPDFEDAVAAYLKPGIDLTNYDWAGREPVERLLVAGNRSDVRIGALGPMVLSVMSNSYEELVSARDRGWIKEPAGGRVDLVDPASQRQVVGFAVAATVYPVGMQGGVTLSREVWYRPVLSGTGFEPVMRYVYRPRPLTTAVRAAVPQKTRRIDFRSRLEQRRPRTGQ